MKSFTEHFIRVWIHTSKISKVSRNISYVYEFIRRRFHTRIKSNAFEKIRVCKIPWMILHNDTRIKSYTYEKLHVWTVTRMKNYTYEKLHVLNIEFWLVHCYTRIDSFTELLIRVCFLTWNFSYVEPLALFVHFGQPYKRSTHGGGWWHDMVVVLPFPGYRLGCPITWAEWNHVTGNPRWPPDLNPHSHYIMQTNHHHRACFICLF